MDSQITLIDPAQPNRNGEVLLFEGNSMWNTVITRQGDPSRSPLYIIKSDEQERETIIYKFDGSIVATITHKSLSPDRISFGNEPSISCVKWLKTGLGLIGNQFPATLEVNGETFKWKLSKMLHVQLFEQNSVTPVATFQPSRKRFTDGQLWTQGAYLSMAPNLQYVRDHIIASLLIVERRAIGLRVAADGAAARAAVSNAMSGIGSVAV